MAMTRLSNLLWHERELLDAVLHRLEGQVAEAERPAGGPGWSEVLAQLDAAASVRAAQVAVVATQLGLRPGCGLQDVANRAPSPWDEIFRGHLAALVELASAMTAAGRRGRELASRMPEGLVAAAAPRDHASRL